MTEFKYIVVSDKDWTKEEMTIFNEKYLLEARMIYASID